MARTLVATQTLANLNAPIGALGAQLTFAAGDNTNNNYFVATGRELLVIFNSAGIAGTITVSSSADQLGRTADITSYSVPAAGYAILGPFPLNGWKQAGSPPTINISPSATTMGLAVVQLPASY